jgi:hypothetical protein
MPNHVRNVLKFSNLKSEDRRFILDTITTAEEKEDGLHHYLDFDKIIPEPRTEDECPDDCKVSEHSHIMEDETKPWFDWYAWHLKYWGTKWNAYDSYIAATPGTITFVFSTAWSTPEPVISKLKLLGFNFELKYADEDIGSNCGKMIYNPDKTGFKDIVHITASDIADPEQFARRLWAKY